MPNFQAKTFVLVHWNGVGPLEPWWACWNDRWDEKVAGRCPYVWVHVDGSPGHTPSRCNRS